MTMAKKKTTAKKKATAPVPAKAMTKTETGANTDILEKILRISWTVSLTQTLDQSVCLRNAGSRSFGTNGLLPPTGM